MAFYNAQNGDAPVLKSLADEFSMSDNFPINLHWAALEPTTSLLAPATPSSGPYGQGNSHHAAFTHR